MTLDQRELKVLSAVYLNSTPGLVNDACELLTAKIILWLRAKEKLLLQDYKQYNHRPMDDPDRVASSARLHTISRIITELSEAP